MNLPVVTYDQFLGFEPCWEHSEQGRRRLMHYSRKLGGKATALDVLRLNSIPAEDRLWAVLREEFIPADTLHEFACRCAEKAMALVENPDPRSIAAIEAKRKWVRGEIDDEELVFAQNAVWDAARDAAQDAAWSAARDDTRNSAYYSAGNAAYSSAVISARGAANGIVWDAARGDVRDAAREVARDAARNNLIDMLIGMLHDE